MNFEGDNSMGTVIISTILFIIVTLIVKSICRKHIEAKKNGSVCCGCSKCSSGCNATSQTRKTPFRRQSTSRTAALQAPVYRAYRKPTRDIHSTMPIITQRFSM